MTSPSVTTTIESQEPIDVLPYMSLWVRGALVCLAVFLTLIFGIAIYLNPYREDGTARQQETHRQLGLPPCTFYEKTGLPCPSCGMTTSFALLIRGDLWHSAQANFAGTLLGTFCLFLIPWSLASIWKQRLLFVRSFETMMTILVASFMGIMLLRWAVVAGALYFFGTRLWI
jgi:Protein of unknown function (DUF2752)